MTDASTEARSGEMPLDVLACPRCDARLDAADRGVHCNSCNVTFPVLAGVPWLFSEPNAALAEWRSRYQYAIERSNQDAVQARTEASAATRESTRNRLTRLADAKAAFAAELATILEPLGGEPSDTAVETHLALKTRLPPGQGIDTYHANIHRDWCWGGEENRASLDLVRAALPEASQSLLVLGAGAGRLAFDLHQAMPNRQTLALDINPLLVFIAATLAAGQPVELHEFPLAPKTAADVSLPRTLENDTPADPGLHWVLGDALRPPFQAGAFDALVTPWFIDIVDQDLATTAARVNRLLAPHGRWVIFGSLAFSGPEYAQRYSLEESVQVIADAGFEPGDVVETTIPYLCSPASRHGRREQVVTISATKATEAMPVERHIALPNWLVRSNLAVPLLPSFEAQTNSTRIYAFVMSMIDGKRSIADMATLMEEQQLMPKAEADAAIRSFLIKMYDESRSGTRY
jgi:uncharacterized protein YbaR (Trm112 family)/ubiquinone/menaquinone biosynthesis C-methylase UbiE